MKTQEMEPDENYWRAKIKENSVVYREATERRETFEVLQSVVSYYLYVAEEAMQCDGEANAADLLRAFECAGVALRKIGDCISRGGTAPPICPPDQGEAFRLMQEKVGNLAIQAYLRQKEFWTKRGAFERSIGDPACAPMVCYGIAKTVSEMGSARAQNFCEDECIYGLMGKCDGHP